MMVSLMWRIRFLNPLSDAEFVQTVQSIMEGGVAGPEELQERLRRFYPSAVVRQRGLSGEDLPAWYVYRDGRWVPSEEPEGGRG